MLSRREFLTTLTRGSAGIAVTGGFATPAFVRLQKGGQTPASRGARRRIVIGGQPVTVIDCFSHIAIPEIWKVIPKNYSLPASLEVAAQKIRSQPIPAFDPRGPEIEKNLTAMDAMGVDIEVVCVGSNYWADRNLSRELTKIQNEKIAELCAVFPDRFSGFGTLSLQHPDLAVEELEQGKKLGMRGFAIGGSVNGEELSNPKFHPVWAKAEQLGTVIFLRGGGLNGVGDQTVPYPNPRFQGHGWLASVIGNPLEITLALAHLIEEGTLDLFPGLKILVTRGGGYIIDDDFMSDKCGPFFPNFCQQVKKHPTEYYLKRLYYDSMHRTPEALRHLISTVGVSQVVLGTDNSQEWNSEAVDRVLEVPGLSDTDRIAILGGNAAILLHTGV